MIPIFIYQELIGPYGQEVLRKLGEIEKFYQIYRRGADFKTDEASEDYTPAKHRSRQIRTLIGKQAQFLFGKTPEHKISCPGEPSDPQKGKINESDMQEYVQKVLKENLWSGKLIKGAKDCFIGGRVALKADIDETRLGLTFVPADGFVYEKFYRFSDYLGITSQMSELLGISSISGILRFGRYPAYHGISEPHLALKSSKTVVETAAYYYAASLSIAAFAEA